MKKCHCCSPTLISGIVFAIIAIIHLIRFFMGWIVTIDGVDIPQWVSLVSVAVFGGLAFCNFKKCCCNKGNCSQCHREPCCCKKGVCPQCHRDPCCCPREKSKEQN